MTLEEAAAGPSETSEDAHPARQLLFGESPSGRIIVTPNHGEPSRGAWLCVRETVSLEEMR